MYRITKDFHFSASHQLYNLPPDHHCSRLHGHNYIIRVELRAAHLDKQGFVIDYGDLTPLKDFIDQTFDHHHLNDALPFQTSAENIAKYLFDWCKGQWTQTYQVSVSETPKTWATYGETNDG